MRVGMIAPVTHAYPPSGYGPWERVTHDLTERLVANGHDVTLFAPAGSATSAHLVETIDHPLTDNPTRNPRLEEQIHLAIAMETAADLELDVVHSHLHVHGLVFSGLAPFPIVTTLHGAAWDEAHHPLLLRYSNLPFVSISDRERSFLPMLNYVATIPHGLRMSDFEPGSGNGGYVAYVGRIAPEKAPDLAIEAAVKAGIPLLMAGPIDGAHQQYFDQLMRGLPKDVDYLGPLERSDLDMLLGDAVALIMPLRWHEPFGLVVIEALASGTPVVAWEMGAMPEIIEDGVTGYLVEDASEAANALTSAGAIDRRSCRESAESRFSDVRMAHDYESVYEQVRAHSMASRI